VDGVLKGTVTDSSSPHIVAGSGFGLQGDGTPGDSAVTEWQDYSGSSPAAMPVFHSADKVFTPAQSIRSITQTDRTD
jgi:hypothetical protein